MRQETAVSDSAVELYLISKADLEATWQFMPVKQRDRFTNDLLSRNGNTLHSFDGDDDGDGDCEADAGTSVPPSSTTASTCTARASPSRWDAASQLHPAANAAVQRLCVACSACGECSILLSILDSESFRFIFSSTTFATLA